MSSLENKTLLITGAASGIGQETARLVKARGARVLAIDVNEPSVDVDGFFRADLSDRTAIDRLAKELPTGIDGLANIAGLPPTRPGEKMLSVNLVGLKHLTYSLVDKMNKGASIVNLASLAGHAWVLNKAQVKGTEDLSFEDVAEFCRVQAMEPSRVYGLTKEAVIVWTIQNRFTWRDKGIRMNAVSPGVVRTPIYQDFMDTLNIPADMADLERAGLPEEIAQVVAFLLSDESGWIRGANIPVDGGIAAHITAQVHDL